MRYLLLIGSDTKTGTPPSPAQSQATLQAFMRFSEEAQKAGKTVVAERLRPEAEARRVRVKAGHPLVTDGPFAETKEALGGFYLLECASREEALGAPGEPEVVDPQTIPDDRLRLVFTCCHPALPAESRVALTLRLVGGLSTVEIARAFLVAEPTIAQRLVRAKRTIRERGLTYEVPAGDELAARLPAVLSVVYLIFNEGYAAHTGDALVRDDLCTEAIRLGGMLAELIPGEHAVLGLLALMELQASRVGARADADGNLVLLADQDRARWDRVRIARALSCLDAAGPIERAGPYQLQAAIAACHARAAAWDAADWLRIGGRYATLAAVAPSPVVELNRAAAIGMAEGPAAGLAALDRIDAEALRAYHLLPSARADFLRRLGRRAEAAAEYRAALRLVDNTRERAFLTARLAECDIAD